MTLVLVAAQARGAAAQDTPPSRADCLNLHEKSQELRKTSKLLDARKVLRSCSNESCPTLIREDCTDWLAEVERSVPSISFEVVLNGKDVPQAKISEGDRIVTELISGTAYEMDAGVHKFKAEIAGHNPIEVTVVVREGEKARVVRFDFTPPPVIPNGPQEPTGPRPIPPTFWVFSGIAVAAAAAGGTFGVLALQKKSQLSCSPLCSSSDVAPVKNMALIADISFGGAILLGGVATYFLLTRPIVPEEKEEKGAKAPSLQPAALLGPGFAGAALGGSF